MKTTIELITLRQQVIARALANALANEFGLFNTRCIEKRNPVCFYNIKATVMSTLNPSNLKASILGIHLN